MFPFKAYDAPIDVDVLVSYEWLARSGIHVHPGRHGLSVERPGACFWVGGLRGAKSQGGTGGARAVGRGGRRGAASPEGTGAGAKRGETGAWKNSPSNYMVRPEFFEEFVCRLKIRPTRDCFALKEDAQCAAFFSPEEDGAKGAQGPERYPNRQSAEGA